MYTILVAIYYRDKELVNSSQNMKMEEKYEKEICLNNIDCCDGGIIDYGMRR